MTLLRSKAQATARAGAARLNATLVFLLCYGAMALALVFASRFVS